MRRTIVTALTVVACFLLQTSVFEFFKLADISPNLLIVLVSSVAVMRGQKEGMLVGFFIKLSLTVSGINAGYILWLTAGRICFYLYAFRFY